MVIMINKRGEKLLISPNYYDFIKKHMNDRGFLFAKLSREILIIRNNKIAGKIVWPLTVPENTYDIEVK